MIIHTTRLFEMEYLQAEQVLKITWFDIGQVSLEEVDSGFAQIREAILSHKVSRLLIDSGKSQFHFSDEYLTHLAKQFLMVLAGTTVKKVARIASKSAERENQYADVQKKAFLSKSLNIQFLNFTEEKEALQWLGV